MPIKRIRHHLNQWSNAGRHIHRADGDFFQATGLYPTLDRQELRRAPAVSSHLTHAGLTDVENMFFDAANSRYVLVGQDTTPDLACTYFSSAWSAVGSAYVLNSSVAVLDGLQMRNLFYAHGTLWYICDDKMRNNDDYTSGSDSAFSATEGQLITYVGGRVYLIQDDMRIYHILTDGSDLEGHYNPADDIIPLFACGLKDDLLIIGAMESGELRVFRTGAYAKTSVRSLQDMATLPCDTGDYAANGCPFCVHDNDLYLLSGDMPNPDGTVTRDLLAYTGYRIERIARIDDGNAAAVSVGLLTWRGELIYYELAAAAATLKMLIGNAFIDLADVASYSASGMAPIAACLGNEILLTGLSGADEGIYHLGGTALQNGNVETAYLDGGHPGVKKRLIDVTLYAKNQTSATTKTLSYKKDDETSYTQIDTETDISERLFERDLGIEFYRIRLKAALADTSTTADVRLAGLSYTFAVGDE